MNFVSHHCIAMVSHSKKKFESSTRYNNQNKARNISGEKKKTWKTVLKIRQLNLTKEKE